MVRLDGMSCSFRIINIKQNHSCTRTMPSQFPPDLARLERTPRPRRVVDDKGAEALRGIVLLDLGAEIGESHGVDAAADGNGGPTRGCMTGRRYFKRRGLATYDFVGILRFDTVGRAPDGLDGVKQITGRDGARGRHDGRRLDGIVSAHRHT